MKWNAVELYKMYHQDGKTLQEIADEFRCTRENIRRVMDNFHITRRRVGRRKQ